MHRNPLILALTASLLGLVACQQTPTPDAAGAPSAGARPAAQAQKPAPTPASMSPEAAAFFPDRPEPPLEPKLRPKTRVLDGPSTEALAGLKSLPTPNGARAYELTFTGDTPLVRELAPGTVLVSAPSAKAPYGFLVKLTEVRRENGVTSVKAGVASLRDAFSQMEVRFKQQLTPQYFKGSKYGRVRPRVPGPAGASARTAGETPSWSKGIDQDFYVPLDYIAYDHDDNPLTTNDQVGTKGKLFFSLLVGFEAYLTDEVLGIPTDIYARAGAYVDQVLDVDLFARGNFTFHKTVPIDTLYFEPFTIEIGPVPLVFLPQLDLVLDAHGQLNAQLEYHVGESFHAGMGLEYDEGFHIVNQPPTLTVDHGWKKAQGNASFEVGPKATAQLLLYGIAGVQASLSTPLKAAAKASGAPALSVDACAAGTAGVHADLWITELSHDANIFSTCKNIFQWTNTPPTLQNVSVTKADLFDAGPITTNTNMKLCGRAEDDVDGSLPVTWTSNFEAIPEQDTDGDGCVIHRFKTVGTHTLTARATDSSGAQASATRSLTVGTYTGEPVTAKVLYPTPNMTVRRTGQSISVPLIGDVGPGVPCVSEQWTSSNPADVLPVNNCGTPVAQLSGDGTRTLTLTGHNAYDRVAGAAVTVSVAPKPAGNQPAAVTIARPEVAQSFLNKMSVALDYVLTDPDNDTVTFQAVIYPKKNPSNSRVLQQWTVSNTAGGQIRHRDFTVDGIYNLSCLREEDYVIEVRARDAVQASPTVVTREFHQIGCIQ